MIKTENDILYNRLKNNIGFHRSKQFKDWFHEEYPGKEMHHGTGSIGKLKTSDYFSIPVTYQQHQLAENDKSNFCIDHLHEFINIMQKYIIFLEKKRVRK